MHNITLRHPNPISRNTFKGCPNINICAYSTLTRYAPIISWSKNLSDLVSPKYFFNRGGFMKIKALLVYNFDTGLSWIVLGVWPPWNFDRRGLFAEALAAAAVGPLTSFCVDFGFVIISSVWEYAVSGSTARSKTPSTSLSSCPHGVTHLRIPLIKLHHPEAIESIIRDVSPL